jgi:hypothetical protein
LTCSGVPTFPTSAGNANADPKFPFLVSDRRLHDHVQDIKNGWDTVEPVLLQVATVLRWRHGLYGDDAPFATSEIEVDFPDGDRVSVHPTTTAVMGDNLGAIDPEGLASVVELVRGNVELLVPHVEALVEDLPSPPLDKLILDVLPQLPVISTVDARRRCPKPLRKTIIGAVEARNPVIHRGTHPELDLRETLLSIRELLYLLDYHAGFAWASAHLSIDTQNFLRS